MIDEKLEQIMLHRPSSISNTLLISLLQVISWILIIVSLVFALGCLFHSSPLIYAVDWMLGINPSDTDVDPQNMHLFRGIAVVFILLALLFWLIIRLCKTIIKRNRFMLDIALWYDNQKEKNE